VDVDRVDERLAVEEGADGDLDADDTLLKLEDLDFLGECLLVRLEHSHDVVAVVLVADEEPPLDVARGARRLDDVARRVLLDVGDRFVEVVEVAVRDDRDASLLQLLLAEGAVVLESVGVGRAADHGLALGAQRDGLLALAERVVEDDDVGPLDVSLPVFGLRYEAVGDVLLLRVSDEVADLVALLEDLPRDVADESRQGHEEELALLLHESGGILRRSGFIRLNFGADGPGDAAEPSPPCKIRRSRAGPMNGRFQTTHWSLVLAARAGDNVASRAAPAMLFRSYWFPLLPFI